MRALLLSALLPSVAFGSELDRAATSLVSDLALPSVEGFALTDDLAISVDLEGEAARLLGGLLLARLAALGSNTAFVLSPGRDADARARNAGAEWLLDVRGRSEASKLALFAELRRIDPGLWHRPPSGYAVPIYATAEHVARFEVASVPPKPPPPEPVTPGTPRLHGPALRIRSVPEPVIALAACALTAPETDDLLVLTPKALAVYSFRGGRLRSVAELDLAPLPRHSAPSRDPVGAIVCHERDVAVGHSGMATGHLVRTGPRDKGLSLEIVSELPGIPVAKDEDGWVVAQTEAGTNRLLLQDGGARSEPVLDARADGDHRDALLAVTTDYRLVRLEPDLSVDVVLGTSGVGISAFIVEGTHYVVTTQNLPAEQDRLTLLTSVDGRRKEDNPVSIQGRVYATTVGRFRKPSRSELIAAARPGRGLKSDLLLVELSEGRP